eukprot:9772478-Alexandrium_andersonii.AAC.1
MCAKRFSRVTGCSQTFFCISIAGVPKFLREGFGTSSWSHQLGAVSQKATVAANLVQRCLEPKA